MPLKKRPVIQKVFLWHDLMITIEFSEAWKIQGQDRFQINMLVQKRCNSSAYVLELHLIYTDLQIGNLFLLAASTELNWDIPFLCGLSRQGMLRTDN